MDEPRESTVMFARESRFRTASVSVWRRSYREYAGWTVAERNAARPAVCALLARLYEYTSEDELHEWYWTFGDPLGRVLREKLPPGTDDERLLTLEEACLWLRLTELREERRDA